MSENDLIIHSIGHATDGYKVTYTVFSNGSKSKVTMPIAYNSIDHTQANVEKLIRVYLLENLIDKENVPDTMPDDKSVL